MTQHNSRQRRRLAAVLAIACLALLAACSSAPASPGGQAGAGAMSSAEAAAEANPNIDLGTSMGNSPAPGFTLANQFGQPMSLSQFRGKVVMLGFEDPECTNVCPLTTQSMLLAKELLGSAGNPVQLLGVSANPDATTVSDVLAYSKAHAMVNQWDFLTGTPAQLKKVWGEYDIAVQVDNGDIDHTPALFIIDQQGRLQKVYLTQMAYSSVGQSAEVLAQELSSLLPGHPKLASTQSLATVAVLGPAASVSLPGATARGDSGKAVPLGPGSSRLVVFFATWLSEVSDLKSQLAGLNAYVKAAPGKHLPALTAVDETDTEPSAAAVTAFLASAGPLDYQVGLDESGRVADGYGVQDQPWFALVDATGKITWSHDGWLPVSQLEAAAAAHP